MRQGRMQEHADPMTEIQGRLQINVKNFVQRT